MRDDGERPQGRLRRAALAVLCAGLGAGLALAVTSLPPRDPGLAPEVAASLDASGVGNPVTAVLLSFRGYDTLLEIAVLLAALTGVRSVALTGVRSVALTGVRSAALTGVRSVVPAERPGRQGGKQGRKREGARHAGPAGPALRGFARLVGPAGVLVSAYLFWIGADAPGGAFQAATVLAATVLLLHMAGLIDVPPTAGTAVRLLSVAGFATFLGIGLTGLATTGAFLGYPEDQAKTLILAIEAVLTVSVATVLLLLVLGIPEEHEP